MIPTMILFGLIFGRWWKACLLVGTAGWPAWLWFNGIISSPQELFAAVGFALGNTLVGVLVHHLLLHLVRAIRDHVRLPDRSRA